MHTSSIAIICHQAIIDFLGSLLLILQLNIPLPHTIGGELLCRVCIGHVTLFLLFVASTYNLLALTLGRYINIVKPLRFRMIHSGKGVAATIAIMWLLVTFIKSYSFFLYSVVDGHTCVFRNFQSSKDHITTSEVGRAEQMHQQHQLLRVRRDMFESLVIVFVTFVVCWTPSQVTYFMFNIGWIDLDDKGPVNVIGTKMTACNCCPNPIIYCFKYKLFRQTICTMIAVQVTNSMIVLSRQQPLTRPRTTTCKSSK
ncbi:ovarian cancer G-protein coupled receptor 1-like [Patiria miniata]|uniref:G-protein coupled receptors family 1 profile domain-containing protein n=1 Tax=Patiria miniata TaxID=46514 RepID=A0A913Z4K7_PATMI|nr:ovarian cancer G-protein coupled receptor 1-like [Patiria miniata]